MITAQAEGVARINSIQRTNLIPPHLHINEKKKMVECFWQKEKTVKTFWIFAALLCGDLRSVSGFASICIYLHLNNVIYLSRSPPALCLLLFCTVSQFNYHSLNTDQSLCRIPEESRVPIRERSVSEVLLLLLLLKLVACFLLRIRTSHAAL